MDGREAEGDGVTEEHIALVTGAGSGLGRAIALELARRGTPVACAYGSNDAGAKETVALIEESGGVAAPFGADVAVEAQVKELFREVKEWRAAPLILIANAGARRDGLAVKYPLDAWERTLGVNLTGAFLCASCSSPRWPACEATRGSPPTARRRRACSGSRGPSPARWAPGASP
jgi:NAD(P)-dependent dehydrogenase (short-subunit alcohol dehydrogenase family)